MCKKSKAILPILLIWTNVVEILLYLKHKIIVDEDMQRYLQYTPYDKMGVLALNYLQLFYKPWRSIFIYRVARKGYTRLLKPIMKHPLDSIELFGKIYRGGGGYYFSTNRAVLSWRRKLERT